MERPVKKAGFVMSAALAAVLLASPMPARAAEETVGKEGFFSVIVFRNGKTFDRCILHQGTGTNVLRIAVGRKPGVYSLSLPTDGQPKDAPISLVVDGKAGITIPITGQDPRRTWSTLPPAAVDAIKAGRSSIQIDIGTSTFSWRLNKDMGMAFIVLNSCAEGYTNGA